MVPRTVYIFYQQRNRRTTNSWFCFVVTVSQTRGKRLDSWFDMSVPQREKKRTKIYWAGTQNIDIGLVHCRCMYEMSQWRLEAMFIVTCSPGTCAYRHIVHSSHSLFTLGKRRARIKIHTVYSPKRRRNDGTQGRHDSHLERSRVSFLIV